MPNITVLLLAAGFGTRLGEITKTTPKPLVPIGDSRLIDCALWQLKNAGVGEVIVNLHYLSELISAYLGDGSRYQLRISYSHEDPILDTGGAIKRVLTQYPNQDILIYNSDAVFGSDLDLAGFIARFQSNALNPLAQLMLRPIEKGADFGVIKAKTLSAGDLQLLQVVKLLEEPVIGSNQEGASDYTFTGIHLLSNRALKYMQTLPEIFHTFKDLYPLFAKAGELITAESYTGFWRDTGTKGRLAEVCDAVMVGKVMPR